VKWLPAWELPVDSAESEAVRFEAERVKLKNLHS
jgi:hypothetical protein